MEFNWKLFRKSELVDMAQKYVSGTIYPKNSDYWGMSKDEIGRAINALWEYSDEPNDLYKKIIG